MIYAVLQTILTQNCFFNLSFYKRVSLLSVCVCNVIEILKCLNLFSCNVVLRCLNLLHSWISIKIWEVGNIIIIMVKWKIYLYTAMHCYKFMYIMFIHVYQYFLTLVFWCTFAVQYFEHLTNWNTCLSYVYPIVLEQKRRIYLLSLR